MLTFSLNLKKNWIFKKLLARYKVQMTFEKFILRPIPKVTFKKCENRNV